MTNLTGEPKLKPNEIITNRIISALNEGIIPWHRPWESLEVMSVDGRPYRGINRMLLSWAGYSDPRFLTYRKCVELGGHVKEGEKGWTVVYWSFRRVKDVDGNETQKQVPFMRYYYVFNVEQCKDLELKPLPIKTIEFEPIEKAKKIIDNIENKPLIKHGGNRACYNPASDVIQMPNPEFFHSIESYYSTVFHELIHSTGHETRLNRELKNYFDIEKYSKEELIAEIGSAFLRAEAHISSPSVDENTIAYVQSWIQALQNDPNMIIRAAGKAQRAVDHIMNRDVGTDDVEVDGDVVEQAA